MLLIIKSDPGEGDPGEGLSGENEKSFIFIS